MSKPPDGRSLRVLHLEDDPNDAELVRAELESNGYRVTIEHVLSRESFTSALTDGAYDLVLSDFALPGFDGLSALRIAKEIAPEVPFISISGFLGEEAAVECVRAGATDYVLKHRLFRLGPAVQRALAEADEHRRRRQAEVALGKTEVQLQQARRIEAIELLAGVVAHDLNDLLTAIMGYSHVLRRRCASDVTAVRDAEGILRAAERAASLTRQLMAHGEMGHQSTFQDYLPPAMAGVVKRPAATVVDPGPTEGTETVLLVEDEETVRSVLRESLELQGYAVVEACNGDEAIAICERRDQPIDLLVTDVEMPKMGGAEVAQRAAVVRPELPVVFMSGHDDHALVKRGLSGAASVLQKPFPPDVLVRKVREVLDAPRRNAA